MIVTVSPASSLSRPLLHSVAALALGFGVVAMAVDEPELSQAPQRCAGDSQRGDAVLALPSANGRADVRVALVVDDGRLAGLALVAVRAGSPWALAGLRDGDVVRVVDGEGVTDLARVLDVLTSQPRHDLAFTRDGELRATHLALDAPEPAAGSQTSSSPNVRRPDSFDSPNSFNP